MAAKVESTVVIARPVEEVFGFVLDAEANMPRWNAAVESVAKTSEGPIGTGSTFQMRGQMMGRRLAMTARLTTVEPNRQIEMEAAGRPIAPRAGFWFEQEDGGTRVTFRGDPNPVGVLKLLSPLVARQAQRLWDGNLARLKTEVEGSAPSGPSGPSGVAPTS
ncbi:MAG: SRPBCC family protein, partial [Acidimicrobiia bacterium]